MKMKLLVPMGIKQKDGTIKLEQIGAVIEVKDDKSRDKRPSQSTS